VADVPSGLSLTPPQEKKLRYKDALLLQEAKRGTKLTDHTRRQPMSDALVSQWRLTKRVTPELTPHIYKARVKE
jgi:hypothetical protein